jgi:Sugar (and other) transporter
LSAADIFRPPILQRLLVGSWALITINTLIFGFVIFLPQFFLRQGLTITNSLGYTVVLACASLVGCAVGAVLSDTLGRRWSIIGASLLTIVAGWFYARSNAASDPVSVLSIGAILLIAIYILQHARARRDRGLAVRGRRADGGLRLARGGLADDRPFGGADHRRLFLGRRAGAAVIGRTRPERIARSRYVQSGGYGRFAAAIQGAAASAAAIFVYAP